MEAPDYLSLRAIVEGVTGRWQTLLSTVGSSDIDVPGLTWTTGELTAHMISVVEHFAEYHRSQAGPSYPYDRLAEFNRHRLVQVQERGPSDAGARLRGAVADFLEATRLSDPADPFPWFDGHVVDVATAHALLSAELLVHGRDLARARGVSWPIPAIEARHTAIGILPAVPASVDPEMAGRLDFHARVRLWGAPTFGFRVRAGEVTVTDGSEGADVTLWVHPTAFLLVSFGRISPLRLALTGRVVAWGRRPWLAFTLPGVFRT